MMTNNLISNSMIQRKLNLNEASLVVNNGNNTNPIEVYAQLEECFGCQPTRLKPITGEDLNTYIISTKHSIHLELHSRALTSNSSCRIDNLSLNSLGQYEISASQSSSNSSELNCSLKTIDYGECLLCPFAVLICIVFAIIAIEQIYLKCNSKSSRIGQHSRRANVDEQLVDDPQSNSHLKQSDSDSEDRESTSENQQQATTVVSTSRNEDLETKIKLSTRIECLDVFRGLTLTGMILVNYGGAGYAWLEHTPWDGITPADFVFPFFIFSMGASIAISTGSLIRQQEKSFRRIAWRIIRRSMILFMLGVCLNSKWIDYEQANGLSKLRLTGVLQRFSISYLIISSMYAVELLVGTWKTNIPYLSSIMGILFEVLTAFVNFIIYIYITFYFDYNPKCPTGYIGPGGQTEGGKYAACTGGAAAWLDRFLIGENHLYQDHELREIYKTQVTHDPEGILGYTTSILLTLIGLQCGKILKGKTSCKSKIISLSQWILVLAISCSFIIIIPINKRLWSLTFIIVTALAAMLVMVALYVLLDVFSIKRAFIIQLLLSAGKNSIFLYVGHSLVHQMLPWWFPISDPSSHLQLLLRLSWSIFVWLLIAQYLALKGLYIRI